MWCFRLHIQPICTAANLSWFLHISNCMYGLWLVSCRTQFLCLISLCTHQTQNQAATTDATEHRRSVSPDLLPLPFWDALSAANALGHSGFGSCLPCHRIQDKNGCYLVVLHVHELDIAQHLALLYTGSIFLLFALLLHVFAA